MSGTRINYNLRPAKHVERKMMCEAFRRLSEFASVDSYRYVGLGSFYFRDFALIHKALGITDMLSIERDREDRDRFDFNVPYSCVKMLYGDSNDILPTLPWDLRTILWLDYEGGLDASVLADVAHFCGSACGGSALVVSLNAHPDSKDKHPLTTLREAVGENNVPAQLTDADMKEWQKARTLRRILTNSITEALTIRNGARPPGSRFVFQQLFNFHYKDGARMLTLGGLLYEKGQESLVEKCGFRNLKFTRTDDEPFHIGIPNLTYKEIRYLDQQLPVEPTAHLQAKGIPTEDLERYADLYRYFPNFAEADPF